MTQAQVDQQYARLYKQIRRAVCRATVAVGLDAESSQIAAQAQAEALVRTLRGVTLRHLPKRKHALYLSRLFSLMLSLIVSGREDIGVSIVVRDRN